MPEHTIPQRGDHVEALLYHAESKDDWVSGTYIPREDLADALPPEDAAWVDTGILQGPLMVKADTVQPVADPPEALRAAIQNMNRVVRGILESTPQVRLPFLKLTPVAVPPVDDEEPDPRHLAVQVRTVPAPGEPSETHTYRDARGLTWTTYGQEHDFSTDRLLEIQNEKGDIVASYPPGAWLHARYAGYVDDTDAMP